jgi:hypothetical protein
MAARTARWLLAVVLAASLPLTGCKSLLDPPKPVKLETVGVNADGEGLDTTPDPPANPSGPLAAAPAPKPAPKKSPPVTSAPPTGKAVPPSAGTSSGYGADNVYSSLGTGTGTYGNGTGSAGTTGTYGNGSGSYSGTGTYGGYGSGTGRRHHRRRG